MELFDPTNPLVRLIANRYTQVLLTIAIVLILQLIINRIIGRLVRKLVRGNHFETKLDEEKRENTLISMFRTASTVMLWLFGVILILWQLDVNVAALATGAGLIGVVVGFGAQSTIKDILAGVFIITENQYRVGDIAKFRTEGGEVSGFVQDITVRITRLRDLDGILHIIPNGSIQMVSNLSFGFANVNVDIDVAYDTDVDRLETIINRVGNEMLKDELWGKFIIEPIQYFRFESFNDSSIRVKALGKVEPAQQWDVAGLFRRKLKVAFEKEGITIPYPQIVVHTATKAAAKAKR